MADDKIVSAVAAAIEEWQGTHTVRSLAESIAAKLPDIPPTAVVDYVAYTIHNAMQPLCSWSALPEEDSAWGDGKERRRKQAAAAMGALQSLRMTEARRLLQGALARGNPTTADDLAWASDVEAWLER